MNHGIVLQSQALKPKLSRCQWIALIIGVVGGGITVGGYLANPSQFFQSYLVAFLYWLSLTMGSAAVLMIHHLAGGRWGFAIRRLLEAASRTLPLMILFFLPVVLGLHELYEWTHAEVVDTDPILIQKRGYLNVSSFLTRAAAYFLVWGGLVYLLNRWSTAQDHTNETYPTRRLQRLSGPGLLVLVLTMTGASVDWIMSLEPHWFSTMFSGIYIIGQILLTWAFMILIATPLSGYQPLDRLLPNERLRDLGTLMLAFVLLWTYTSFSQFLIIWAGNLPEEITWYMTRINGSWGPLGYMLIALHFVIPFLLLISSRIKSRTPVLFSIAAGLVIMRFVDLFWNTMPAFYKNEMHFHWLDLTTCVAMGGFWFSLFFDQLKRRSLIALNDPRFNEFLTDQVEAAHG